MDAGLARDRLTQARVARLATLTDDLRPHVVPCCFALDGDTAYSAVDAKPKTTQALRRLANVEAHPWASLLVDHYEEDWRSLWWVRVDGRAWVLARGAEHDGALAMLAAKYPQYMVEPPPGPVLALAIERWRAWP